MIAFNSIHAKITWTLLDDGTLTISGTDMPNYFRESSPWTSQRDKIKKVIIEKGVTSIGDYAFFGCSGLTSITIPNSVASIGDCALAYCLGLTSIIVEQENKNYDSRNNCNAIIEKQSNTLIVGCKKTVIPNSVTSIGGHAFYRCSGLTSITIPNSVTSIGDNAFYGCI